MSKYVKEYVYILRFLRIKLPFWFKTLQHTHTNSDVKNSPKQHEISI